MLELLTHNWPLKLLAVALAFAIWVSVTGEDRVVQDFSLPLEVNLSNEPVVLSSEMPNTVLVRLRGAQSLMRRLDPVPLSVSIDMSQAPPGDHDVLLSQADVLNVPRGIDVEFIQPDRLALKLERRRSRELAVEVTTVGQPPEGFHYYGSVADPAAMKVEGPESEIEILETLRTNPIRLNLRTEPFVVRVNPQVEGNVRVVDPQFLEVRVNVAPAPSVRKLAGLPIELVGAPRGSRVSPDRVDVTLSGPPAILDRVLPEQVRVVADASGLLPANRAQQVDVVAELTGISPRDRSLITVKSISRPTVSLRTSGAEL